MPAVGLPAVPSQTVPALQVALAHTLAVLHMPLAPSQNWFIAQVTETQGSVFVVVELPQPATAPRSSAIIEKIVRFMVVTP
jgi:hypothetical protein